MNTKGMIAPEVIETAPRTPEEWRVSELLKQYGCGPTAFVGSENAFCERHPVFDRIVSMSIRNHSERDSHEQAEGNPLLLGGAATRIGGNCLHGCLVCSTSL